MYLFKETLFDCKQATLLSIKKDEGKISPIERLKLWYHLLHCDPCRRFIDQSHRIQQAGQGLNQALWDRPPFILPDDVKQHLQRIIDQKTES